MFPLQTTAAWTQTLLVLPALDSADLARESSSYVNASFTSTRTCSIEQLLLPVPPRPPPAGYRPAGGR